MKKLLHSTTPYYFSEEMVVPVSLGVAWEVLSDTNTMNRALGLPKVSFSEPYLQGDLMVRNAVAKYAFLKFKWIEFPFEWQKGKQYTVLRDFSSGPLRKFWGGISFLPAPDHPNHTRIKIFCHLLPANIIAVPLIKLLGKFFIKKSGLFVAKAIKQAQNAFQVPIKPRQQSSASHVKLWRTLANISNKAPVNPVQLKLLETHIRQSPDNDVLLMQPYKLADEWGQNRKDILRLFLYCTIGGLLDLEWSMMCTNCRVVKAETKSLRDLPEMFHCDFCGIDFENNLDKFTELRFSVKPEIRAAESTVFCIGNPSSFEHIYAQVIVPGGETRNLELQVAKADLRLRVIRKKASVRISATDKLRDNHTEHEVVFKDGKWNTSEIKTGSGKFRLNIVNNSVDSLLCILDNPYLDNYAATALEVTGMKEFRRFFSSEILAPGKKVGIQNLCMMFTDLKSSTSLYEKIGDAPAFARVSKHFEFIERIVGEFDGYIVKTIGDAVMAQFPELELGIKAAMKIQSQVLAFNRENGFEPAVVIKIGLHDGPAVAMSANGAQDFFGRTVNYAVRIQDQSIGGDIVVEKTKIDTEEIRTLLSTIPHKLEFFKTKLKGFDSASELARLEIK